MGRDVALLKARGKHCFISPFYLYQNVCFFSMLHFSACMHSKMFLARNKQGTSGSYVWYVPSSASAILRVAPVEGSS